MRRVIIVFLALCLVLALIPVMGGCSLWPVVRGSGDTVEQSYEFSGFTRISAGWAFDVTVSEAKSYAVKISVDDNLQEYLDVHKDGDTLNITLKHGRAYSNTHLKAEVKLPRLTALTLSGASKGNVSGFASNDDFRLEVSGASHASLADMGVERLVIEVSGASSAVGDVNAGGDAWLRASGASTMDLSGRAKDANLEVSGASTVDLEDFSVQDAHAEVSGASNATVNASGTLSAEVSGASHLYYTGSPKLGDIETSGASSIDRR
jgi:ribosomal protein L31